VSRENVDLIHIAYDIVWPQRSFAGFEEHIAEGFVWRQRREWLGRPVYTRDELPELWADLDETYSEYRVEALDYTDAGDRVVVRVKTSAHLKASDIRVERVMWHVWRVQDGRVSEVSVHGTRDEADAAAA